MARPDTRDPERLSARTTTSGVLLAAASVPLGVSSSHGPLTTEISWLALCTLTLVALLLFAGLQVVAHPHQARIAATLGLVGTFALGWPRLSLAPAATLAASIASMSVLVLLWKVGAPMIGLSLERPRPRPEGQAQGAALLAVLLWLIWSFSDVGAALLDTLVVGWAVAISSALSLRWAVRNLRQSRAASFSLLVSFLGASLLAAAVYGQWWKMLSSLVIPCLLAALLIRPRRRFELEVGSWWEPLLGHPERLFVGTFASLCLAGTILLALPQSSTKGASVGLLDAFFTATSAVCVTGLIVLDTPVDFSFFGQLVLLILIQVGGLGIMTFSTAALRALGRRLSLRHEGAVASLISAQDRGRLFGTAKHILLMTLAVELLGALTLAVAFVIQGDGVPTALWRGVFTSISAFCNAGFALQSDSLVPYQNAPLILHTVGVLIILGGLSPAAVVALPTLIRRRTAPVSAQAQLALVATGSLLIVGFLSILAFEWNGSLGTFTFSGKLHNAWFQSVTLRTAGFNSVDLSLVGPATMTVMLALMFIGGSPGGTAGGVKTTTVSVLALAVTQAIQGKWVVEIFGKRVGDRSRTKAAIVVTIAASTGALALLAVQLTQDLNGGIALFEVVSALGTVGLSLGGTAQLDGIGKLIIIACMFVGRVGGLTLLMQLSSRRAQPTLGRPEEEIDVG